MRCAVLSVWLVGTLCGCAEDEPPRASRDDALVEPEDWTSLARDEDPFVTDLDAAPACTAPDFRIEDAGFIEIDTGLCNWVTLRAPARFTVPNATPVSVELSHYDLSAAAPSAAQVRLSFDACDIWTKTIEIPSPANVYMETIAAPCGIQRGQRVLLHLHNHGQNTYQLRALSAAR
jgi:hypothetical protein